MGLFDFFDRFNFSNPEAQLINSPMFNTQSRSTQTPIKYGTPGSTMVGNMMNKMGLKKEPGPIGGGGMQGNMEVVRPSDIGGDPLTAGKTYAPTKQEMLQQGVKNYVPKGYQGLEKSGQIWGNVGGPITAEVNPGLNSGNTLGNAGYSGLGDGYAVIGKQGAANMNMMKKKIDKGMVITGDEGI